MAVERISKLNQWKRHSRIIRAAIVLEQAKSSSRAKVEPPFRIVKCQFGFIKARYRGLAKNHNKLAMIFAWVKMIRLDQMCCAQ